MELDHRREAGVKEMAVEAAREERLGRVPVGRQEVRKENAKTSV
jgi:hypothetical protein